MRDLHLHCDPCLRTPQLVEPPHSCENTEEWPPRFQDLLAPNGPVLSRLQPNLRTYSWNRSYNRARVCLNLRHRHGPKVPVQRGYSKVHRPSTKTRRNGPIRKPTPQNMGLPTLPAQGGVFPAHAPAHGAAERRCASHESGKSQNQVQVSWEGNIRPESEVGVCRFSFFLGVKLGGFPII